MYAVDSNGTKITPGPSARIQPIENVIMNVTDPNRFVYHYTSLDTAKKIIKNFSLRMGEFMGTNDPKESKEWHFDLLSDAGNDFRGVDAGKLSSDLSDTIKRHSRVLCFCRDSAGLTGNHLDDISHRGYFKARMWAQYGSSHKDSNNYNHRGDHSGVCFVFNRVKLIECVKEDCGGDVLLHSGDVTYRNRHVVARREEKDYFIDFDVLKKVGFDRYWKFHASRYRQRLFFEKSLDWRDESEFRALALLAKPREVFINIQNCLCGLFLGEKCNLVEAKELIDDLMNRGVHVMGLSWKNCTPWYDFRNSIYNFSARALEQEIDRRKAGTSPV